MQTRYSPFVTHAPFKLSMQDVKQFRRLSIRVTKFRSFFFQEDFNGRLSSPSLMLRKRNAGWDWIYFRKRLGGILWLLPLPYFSPLVQKKTFSAVRFVLTSCSRMGYVKWSSDNCLAIKTRCNGNAKVNTEYIKMVFGIITITEMYHKLIDSNDWPFEL